MEVFTQDMCYYIIYENTNYSQTFESSSVCVNCHIRLTNVNLDWAASNQTTGFSNCNVLYLLEIMQSKTNQ